MKRKSCKIVFRIIMTALIGGLFFYGCMIQQERKDAVFYERSDEVLEQEDSLICFTSLEKALENPSEVKCLSLADNELSHFPKEILRLKNLQYLDLAMNQFDSLPNEIGKLTELKSLNFAYGEVSYLPPTLGMLKKLKELNLLDNEVKIIPNEIGEAESLEIINLSLNPLQDLPISITNLKRLRVLSFDPKFFDTLQVPKSKVKILISELPSTTIYYDYPRSKQ